jgi:hypothetical protein
MSLLSASVHFVSAFVSGLVELITAWVMQRDDKTNIYRLKNIPRGGVGSIGTSVHCSYCLHKSQRPSAIPSGFNFQTPIQQKSFS